MCGVRRKGVERVEVALHGERHVGVWDDKLCLGRTMEHESGGGKVCGGINGGG